MGFHDEPEAHRPLLTHQILLALYEEKRLGPDHQLELHSRLSRFRIQISLRLSKARYVRIDQDSRFRRRIPGNYLQLHLSVLCQNSFSRQADR